MTRWINIELRLDGFEVDELLQTYNKLRYFIENDYETLTTEDWINFTDNISAVLKRSYDDWEYLFQSNSQQFNLTLVHSKSEILNLPWQEARIDGKWPLFHFTNINISYSKKPIASCGYSLSSLPLKVLVVISSPIDYNNRLNYEKEFSELRKALFHLEVEMLAKITITSSGSIEQLKKELDENSYDILHFNGHSNYLMGKSYLVLEDPHTLYHVNIPSEEFVDAISKSKNGKKIKLIFLGSCNSATEITNDEGPTGIAQQLIDAGFSAVLAMTMKTMDETLNIFASTFYAELAMGKELVDAVKSAQMAISQRVSENQRIIPRLYLGKEVNRLFDSSGISKFNRSTTKVSFNIPGFPQFESLSFNNLNFYGRRIETEFCIRAIKESNGVRITGLIGTGKTALAINIAERLLADFDPYYFNVLETKLDSVYNLIRKEKGKKIHKEKIFIFDNYNYIQTRRTPKPLKEGYERLLEELVINYKIKIIIVCQFAIDLPSKLKLMDLQICHADSLDFNYAVWQLFSSILTDDTKDKVLTEISNLCFNNYLMLKKLKNTIDNGHLSLKKVLNFDEDKLQFRYWFIEAINLFKILDHLSSETRKVLFFINYYPQPILIKALEIQKALEGINIIESINELCDWSLVEVKESTLLREKVWYASDIVNYCLSIEIAKNQVQEIEDFSFHAAYEYLFEIFKTTQERGYLNSAYHFASQSRDKKYVSEVGPILVDHLHGIEEYERSIEVGEEILKILGKNDAPAKLFNQMGVIYRNLNKIEKSFKYFELGLSRALENNDIKLSTTISLNIIRLLISDGKNQKAFKFSENIIKRVEGCNDESEAFLYQNLAYIMADEFGDHKTSLFYAEKSKKIYNSLNNLSGLAASQVPIIEILISEGNTKEAEYKIRESLELTELSKNSAISATIQFLLAKLLFRKGEINATKSVLNPLLGYCEAVNDIQLMVKVEDLIRKTSNIFDEKSLLKKIESSKEEEKYISLISYVIDLSSHYLDNSNWTKAKGLLLKYGVPSTYKVENFRMICSIHNQLGMAYKNLGDLGKAFESMKLAYDLAKDLNDVYLSYIIAWNLGDIYFDLSKIILGRDLHFEALLLAKRMGNFNYEMELIESLTPCCLETGDHEKLKYLKTRNSEIKHRIPKSGENNDE